MRSSHSVVATNQTRVQASKSSAKIILDDHQTGYLAVVPPDIDRDLMKYAAPAREGTIGPRPIKASMLFEYDYRPKISSLLPHESHKEISAHLNIAWKSIGQDILQLYKDLARRVEQKLKILNGEISEESSRAISKRKSAALGSRRTSRDPPPNSGLRRCNCRPDCPKYKIIPGSDLEKRWLSRFNRGERQRTVVLDSGGSLSDVGGDLPPSAIHPGSSNSTPPSSGPSLFGGYSNGGVAPQNQSNERQEEADELPDALLPEAAPHSSMSTSQQPQQHYLRTETTPVQRHPLTPHDGSLTSSPSAPRPGEAVPSTPMDIARAAAVAANVDPNAVYYAMPPIDPHQQHLQQQLQQRQLQQQQMQQHQLQQQQFQQQQHMYYNSVQASAYHPVLPYVDPHNQEQMAQLQGSFIYPNGIIVNAFGEEIARTLPPSEFANVAPAAPPATAAAKSDHQIFDQPQPAVAEETTSEPVVGVGNEAIAVSDSNDMVVNAPDAAQSVISESTTNAVEAEIGMEIMEGQVAEVQVGIGQEEEIASNVTSPLSSIGPNPAEMAEDSPFPASIAERASNGSAAATPESPFDPCNVEAAIGPKSVQPVEEAANSSLTRHQEEESPSSDSTPINQPSPSFTWHQVQAAEGREVPAQEIGWSWKKNQDFPAPAQSVASLASSDKKDEEKKEKLFALQANIDGIETESAEYAELKASDRTDTPVPPHPPLDPRQELVDEGEVEEKAELKALGDLGDEEDNEEEDEEIRAEDDEDREEGEIDDEEENVSGGVRHPSSECSLNADVGVHDLTASDFDDGVSVGQQRDSDVGTKEFLDDSRVAD